MTIGDIVKLLLEKGISAERIGNYVIQLKTRSSMVQALDIITQCLDRNHSIKAIMRPNNGVSEYFLNINDGRPRGKPCY